MKQESARIHRLVKAFLVAGALAAMTGAWSNVINVKEGSLDLSENSLAVSPTGPLTTVKFCDAGENQCVPQSGWTCIPQNQQWYLDCWPYQS